MSDYIISHIVAAASNNTIGLKGELPWHIPEDLQFFHDMTKGHAIVMGRKTFESLGKPLPDRLNVVVTRQEGFRPEGTHVFNDIQKAVDFCKTKTSEYGSEIFIIGGGEIYRQSMDMVDKIYLTRIHQEFEGDAFYPDVDENIFQEVERRERLDQPVPYTFLTYVRKKNI